MENISPLKVATFRCRQRTGGTKGPLTVRYQTAGDATAGQDYQKLAGAVTIPSGASSALIPVRVLPTAAERERLVVVTLDAGREAYPVGCPGTALVAIGRSRPQGVGAWT